MIIGAVPLKAQGERAEKGNIIMHRLHTKSKTKTAGIKMKLVFSCGACSFRF